MGKVSRYLAGILNPIGQMNQEPKRPHHIISQIIRITEKLPLSSCTAYYGISAWLVGGEDRATATIEHVIANL